MNRGARDPYRDLLASVPDLPRAACIDTDPALWSSDVARNESPRSRDERVDRAVAICRSCPELAACRTWAGANRLYELNSVVAGGIVIPSVTGNANKRHAEKEIQL